MEKQEYTVAETFNINVPKSVKVTGINALSMTDGEVSQIPEVEIGYVFRQSHLRDVLAWWQFGARGEGLYLTGATGTGKSSLVLQLAAKLNWPVQRVTGHCRLEFSDLVGRPVIQADGSMSFQYGPMAHAMKEGHLFLIDEMDMLDPGVAAGLNGIVQGEPLTIPENGGEVIQPHADFRIAATGNTAGNGDGGLYLGTSRQNMAFMDRFWIVQVDYPGPETEKDIISSFVSLEDSEVEKFVNTAGEIRRLFVNDEVEVTLSTRVLIRWTKMTQFFYSVSAEDRSPLHYALDRALLNRAEPETAEAIHEVVQRYFGE